MRLRTITTVLFLSSGTVSLSGQEVGEGPWRTAIAAADELKSEGRFADSERMFRSALEEARRLEPDLAPAATTYHNLAGLYQDTGRCDAAIEAYQRSLELWERVGERGEDYLLRTANHAVGAYLECGDLKAAEHHYRALVAPRVAGRSGRERDPDVAQALGNLALIEYAKHRYREARSELEEAIAIRERAAAGPPLETGVLLSNLAFALAHTGEMDEALARSERAAAIFESGTGPSDPLLISALVNRADLLLMARRGSEAEPLLERALRMARDTFGEENPLTATVMSHYAATLRAGHRKKEAAVLERRAREIREKMAGPLARQTVDVRELSLK